MTLEALVPNLSDRHNKLIIFTNNEISEIDQ